MSNYVERVARGVLWLDHMHDGWREKVDLSTLNLTDPWKCILGQVSGTSYWDAQCNMIGSADMAADMGFNVFEDELYEDNCKYDDGEIEEEEYQLLTAWPYAHMENEWHKVLSA
jgi:hypothetical protein